MLIDRLQIGLDFDGVLCDLSSLTHRAIFDLFGRHVPIGRERKDFMINDGILSLEEYDVLVTEMCCTTRYLEHMTPLPGVSTYLTHMRTLAKEVEFRVITARRTEGTRIAQRWIKGCCLPLKVVSANANGSKRSYAEGLDVYVDDDIRHLHEVEGVVPHRFLFSWPYNEVENHDMSIVRVRAWNELYEHISKIARTPCASIPAYSPE